MKSFLNKYKLEVIGAIAGAFAGWLYWFYVGCASGTCAITSSPVNSTLYGAFMGGVFLSLFKPNKKTKQEQKEVK